MRASISKFRLAIIAVFPAFVILCGVSLITYGTWLLSHPAGFITGGILLILVTILALIDSGRP